MTKQILLIIAGAVIIFAGVLWVLSAQKAEAPIVLTPNVTTDAGTIKEVAKTDTAASTTILTNNMASTAPKSVATPTPTPKTLPKPIVARKPSITVVTYDGQNFSPNRITIRQGGTVRYLNLSINDMWIASNIHPLHSEYPIRTDKDCAGSIFDECKGIGKGEYWDFTFNVEGGWGYHNHKHPISEGEVRVLLPNERM